MTLPDLLRDAADGAPSGAPDPGLWDRGRRVHRRRRVGTAVVVLATLALLASLLSYDRARSATRIEPASGGDALPTRIWEPSPWLPTTDEKGPLGRLAAMVPAARGTWRGARSELGWVGISAATGEYRFLDLPGLSGDGSYGAVLSPDGRAVAYWSTGPTTDTPNTERGGIAAIGFYDTVTGEVRRQRIETAHGLEPQTLAWAGDDLVLASYGQISGGDDDSVMKQSSSTVADAIHRWWPRDGIYNELESFADGQGDLADLEAVSPSAAVVHLDGNGWSRLDLQTGERDEVGRPVDLSGSGVSALSPDGDQVLTVSGTSNPGPLTRQELAGESAPMVVPGPADVRRVVAVLDDRTAVVERLETGADLDTPDRHALTRVDLRTGQRTDLVLLPPNGSGGDVVATDLLGVPPVDRPKPPRPLDPRARAAALGGVAIAGLLALVMWRRRVRL